ncbi:MAG: Replication-associated recombination protein A [bacterium ADurb.Bin431]|nr:MAG: Replication-associated recombination protein A [bacterium ADurb.Bin431]HNY89969.1 replication-associated recombination protein A [bacterium]HOH09110.1 replication-associated recombination protein A [bacterium]HPG81852.1 replication-associated recombination protein A [bacterium]
MDLFEEPAVEPNHPGGDAPLADRLRPATLAEFVGQSHLLGQDKIIRRAIESRQLVSMILWGPPGTGKTTLARIIAREGDAHFSALSAVTAGVADVRKIIAQAKQQRRIDGRGTLLFIDEIHRFNKGQQDALLHSVEDGTLLLIGATTENPSFEVIPALLSRCRVYKLEALSTAELGIIIDRALEAENGLKSQRLQLDPEARQLLITLAGGDARNLLTALELAGRLAHPDAGGVRAIDRELIQEAMQRRTLLYDKQGEYHYDVISAFIKSVRGSDPDAALYWLARMLDAGEDPLFIARRLIILASEDIGNADPHGLMVATAAFQAVHAIGLPEGRIVLAQATTYLACAPKSNASYLALEAAGERVRAGDAVDVPLHLRNAPTRMMKEFGYASGYKYPHDYGGFAEQNYLPEELKTAVFYHPTENGIEKKIKERLLQLWPGRKR